MSSPIVLGPGLDPSKSFKLAEVLPNVLPVVLLDVDLEVHFDLRLNIFSCTAISQTPHWHMLLNNMDGWYGQATCSYLSTWMLWTCVFVLITIVSIQILTWLKRTWRVWRRAQHSRWGWRPSDPSKYRLEIITRSQTSQRGRKLFWR